MTYPMLRINRFYQNGTACAGIMALEGLDYDSTFSAITIEDPVRAIKEAGVTAIPEGIYDLMPRTRGSVAARHKERYDLPFLWEIMGVPGFTDVLIHVGNDADDTAGCILPNSALFFNTWGTPTGGKSSAKLKELMILTSHYEGGIGLTITNTMRPVDYRCRG